MARRSWWSRCADGTVHPAPTMTGGEGEAMVTLEEIEAAIEGLPHDEFYQLVHWVQSRFEDEWDREFFLHTIKWFFYKHKFSP